MRNFLLAICTLVLPVAALAQSGWDGKWKKQKEQFPNKPYEYSLSEGTFHCGGVCYPQWTIPADGQDHAVSGDNYVDTRNVKVIDDHTIEATAKKAGKTVSTMLAKVSADGKTIDWDIVDSTDSNADPVKIKGKGKRVTDAPSGAHVVSGGWLITKSDVSDNGSEFTLQRNGQKLSMTTPTGQSFDAPLDGSDSPFHGDPGQDSVSLKKVDDRTIKETDKLKGKDIETETYRLSADGKSLTVEYKSLLSDISGSQTFTKE